MTHDEIDFIFLYNILFIFDTNIEDHISISTAITMDNANVKGYTAWSLMDNMEWAAGYTERFGLYWVNFTDPNRERIPKDSVSFLSNVFQLNGFQRDITDPWTHFAEM